jgi:hypothetical protein
MRRRLAIKYSVYDFDTGEVIIKDMQQGPSDSVLNPNIEYVDTDCPIGKVYDHFFNIKVSTLEK